MPVQLSKCMKCMGDQARTQAAQNKMIKGEAEVKKLNQAAGQLVSLWISVLRDSDQEIKAEKQLIKTSEDGYP